MSQDTPSTKTIDGVKYEIYMLPPMDSHELLMDVAKMVGPAFGPVLDKLFTGKTGGDLSKVLEQVLEQDLGTEFFSKALGSLFSHLDKATMNRVIVAFRSVTHVDGAPLDKTFDRHFQGEIGSMYKWLAFGMNVQWGKSLTALVSGAEGLPAVLGKQSQSPVT